MTGRPPGLRRVEQVMGTAISLHIADELPPGRLAELADQTFAWLHEVDRRFSTYRGDSEISRLAAGTLSQGDCAPDVVAVLDSCANLWRTTGGWFDPYATGSLDPSGYVKGWAAQIASDGLASNGAGNHCINAGGDVRVRGQPAPGRAWRVGIRHPWQAAYTAWILEGTDLAVATSAIYERGPHVINPYTGRPATFLRSVTVVGPDLGIADAYATAALAMGEAGLDWLATLHGYESAAVCADGRAFRSNHLPIAPTIGDVTPADTGQR